jgi:hypothetical protein
MIPAVADPDLVKRFHAAMVEIFHEAKRQVGYNATYFLRMVTDLGGLAAARRLLHSPTVSDGFTALWERGRLDLSVEALVLQEHFRGLFTEQDLERARERLAEYGYRPRSTDA